MQLSNGANERLWEALFREALIINLTHDADEMNSLENDSEIPVFSENFRKVIKKETGRIGHKERLKNAFRAVSITAVSAAAVMGVAFTGLLTQSEVYASVSDVIRNVFSTHDKYTFDSESDVSKFDDGIRLGYVPEGYELRNVFYGGYMNSLTYESESDSIYFTYSIAGASAVTVDNEFHDYKLVTRDGTDYYTYIAEPDEDMNVLLWKDDYYLYTLEAAVSEEELMRMAESVGK